MNADPLATSLLKFIPEGQLFFSPTKGCFTHYRMVLGYLYQIAFVTFPFSNTG